MEKQFNSDMEQTNVRETLTSMVGQSQSQGTPRLNILYTDPEDGSSLYLMKLEENEYYLWADIKSPLSITRTKEAYQIFLSVIVGLIERGLDHVNAWVPYDEKNIRFAEFFGFEQLGNFKLFYDENSTPHPSQEMIYIFPEIEDESENA